MKNLKQTFEEKVTAFKKQGSKNKVKKLYVQVSKEVEDQIEAKERKLKDLKSLQEDKESDINDFIFNVELDRLERNSDIKEYAKEYLQDVITRVSDVSIQDKIEVVEEEIKVLKATIKRIDTATLDIEEEA